MEMNKNERGDLNPASSAPQGFDFRQFIPNLKTMTVN